MVGLRGSLVEESLSSLRPSIPGCYVQVQYVLALGSDSAQELLDCQMIASGNAQFKILHVSNVM